MIKRNGITGVVLATVLAGTGVAFAEGADDASSKDAQAIVAAKVSPAQAIQSAEPKPAAKPSAWISSVRTAERPTTMSRCSQPMAPSKTSRLTPQAARS